MRPRKVTAGWKQGVSRERLAKVRDVGFVLFLVVAAGVNFSEFREYVVDDAFITYRYAANLAAGEGFVFNPGERVLGTSTPLYTLLLAALALAGLPPQVAGGLVFSCALSLSAFLAGLLLRRQGLPNAGVLTGILIATDFGGTLTFFGLETSLYLALILLAILAHLEDRPWLTGVILGLVCLTRYDGVVLAAVLLADRWWRERSFPWRGSLVCGSALAAWLLFAWAYFGSPLPNTLAAKSGAVGFLDYLAASAGWAISRPVRLLAGYWLPAGPPGAVLRVLQWLLIAGALIGLPRLFHRRPRLWILPLFAVLLWIGYAAIGPPVAHHWYLVPSVILLFEVVVASWGFLTWNLRPASAPAFLTLLVLGIAFFTLPAGSRRTRQELMDRPLYRMRIGAYDELIEWMRRHDLERASLLTHEPGYLAYRTDQYVVDAAGLVSEGIFFHGPSERRSELVELLDRRPTDLVIRSSWLGGVPPGVEGYLPVQLAQPLKLLLLRRGRYEERLDDLLRAWQVGGLYAGPVPASAPQLHLDFAVGSPPGWHASPGDRRILGVVRDKVRWEGEVVGTPLLNTYGTGRAQVLWSDPFRIDFDEVVLRFAGSGGNRTVAQLFVDGLLVLEARGDGGAVPLELRNVGLPTYPWRGHTGVLRLVDQDRSSGFVAADRIRSGVYHRAQLYDDFDGAAYGGHWRQTFGKLPTPSRELARRLGLRFAVGQGAATSLFRPGPQRMESTSFRIEHDRVVFLLYDFGGAQTGVRLVVDGEVVREHRGRSTGSLAVVKWDLRDLDGRRGRLVVDDADPHPDRGIGIDAVVFFDLPRP